MADTDQNSLYGQIFDILLKIDTLKDHFTPFSAQDIKKIISSALNNKHKDPLSLQHLYILEDMIGTLRKTFEDTKKSHTGS